MSLNRLLYWCEECQAYQLLLFIGQAASIFNISYLNVIH